MTSNSVALESRLKITEVFFSIQGEANQVGWPTVFVRLTGCPLRCQYCDTAYAFTEGVPMSIDDILQRVDSFNCGLVEITGGEPLAQDGVHDLMKHLCDRGYEVLLETGGSLDVSHVDPRVRKIMDLKCPSSGMVKKNLLANVEHLLATDEVKFVVGDRTDFEWAVEIIQREKLLQRCHVLMSVVFDVLEPIALAEWILESGLPVRFQLQTHKYIWAPEMRGV